MLRGISCSAGAIVKAFIALNQAVEYSLLRILFWFGRPARKSGKSGNAGEGIENKIYSTVGTIQLLMIA